MTEPHNGKKTWSAKQNWIKDTLTKSGTDLMDISKVKAGAKVAQKKTNGKGKSLQKLQEIRPQAQILSTPFCFGIRSFSCMKLEWGAAGGVNENNK